MEKTPGKFRISRLITGIISSGIEIQGWISKGNHGVNLPVDTLLFFSCGVFSYGKNPGKILEFLG